MSKGYVNQQTFIEKVLHFIRSGKFGRGVLTYAVALLLVFITLFASLCLGVFSKNAVYNAIVRDEVSSAAYDDIMAREEAFLIPNGVTSEVLEGVIDLGTVQADLLSYADTVANGVDFELDTSDREKLLNENVLKFLEEKQVTITKELDADINTFSKECLSIYKQALVVPYADDYRSVAPVVLLVLLGISLVLVGILIALLVILGKASYYRHRFARYMASFCGASALVLLVMTVLIKASHIVERLQFQPAHLKAIIVAAYDNTMSYITTVAVVLAVLFVVSTLSSEFLRRKFIIKLNSHNKAPAGFQQTLIDFIEDPDDDGASQHVVQDSEDDQFEDEHEEKGEDKPVTVRDLDVPSELAHKVSISIKKKD